MMDFFSVLVQIFDVILCSFRENVEYGQDYEHQYFKHQGHVYININFAQRVLLKRLGLLVQRSREANAF
jgi:hypothetical protein